MIDDDALLEQLLAEAGVTDAPSRAALRPYPRSAAGAPLSFAQEVLWLLDRSTPGLTSYNLPVVRRIVGPLDVAALERGIGAIVERHEILRTRFPAAGEEPVQIVDPPAAFTLRRIDLEHVPAAERDAATAATVAERAAVAFDLDREPLFRASLIRRAADDHVLVLETHHMVWDGVSFGVFQRELSALYRGAVTGEPAAPAPLRVQYADYAAWQRDVVSGERLEGLLDHWREELADCVEPLAIPSDFRRASIASADAIQASLLLEPDVVARLSAFARAHDATLYNVVMAAYAAVLHRYTGQTHVLIGSNVAARTEPETETLIGYFNKTVPVRADFTGDPPFGELVRRVRDASLGAYDNHDVPLEKLVLELQQGDHALGRAPLFNAVLSSVNTNPAPLELHGCRVEPFGVELPTTKFDLTLFMSEAADGVRLVLKARADLWRPATIDRFFGHFRAIVEAGARSAVSVSALPMLTPAERAQLDAWNPARTDEPAPDTLAAFLAAARRVPDRIAVRAGDETLTYAELAARAARLATQLRAHGVRAGDVVGILLERSAAAIVAMLGTLHAGAAYAPLALEQPAARLARQVQACGARIVVTLGQYAERVDGVAIVPLDRDAEQLDAAMPDAPVGVEPDALAYVLFTSGSTGEPKPVAITRANIASYTRAVTRVLAGEGDGAVDGWSFALTSTLAADLGNTALYPALCGGGTLHAIDHDLATDPERFAAYAAAHPLDVMKMTPSHLRALLAAAVPDARAALLPRRRLVLGGERFTWELAGELEVLLRARTGDDVLVLNHYGPTETTVGAATFVLTPEAVRAVRDAGAASVPLGRPLADARLAVCDSRGNELPVGVPGELVIAGDGVAAGYLHRPDLTGERFVTLDGARAYRTGDRVRRLRTGDVEFLGRVDAQVKVRGFRVELGEIEAALAQHPDVTQAVVVLRGAGDADEPVLAAYLQSAGDSTVVREHVRAFVSERLPAHMVPTAIVVLEKLPLSRNGKIDRAALPDPAADAAAPAHVAPRTDAERDLVAIWTDVFKREPGTIGVTDDFFALGGHSLLAIRLLGKISRVAGVRLALRALFDNPTIERLARVLPAAPPREVPSIGRARARNAPRADEGARP